MLKGKKSIYILIPLNILIWGFFAYRFYTLYHQSDELVANNSTPQTKIDDIRDSVNYKLNLAYEDPFLKKDKAKTQALR